MNIKLDRPTEEMLRLIAAEARKTPDKLIEDFIKNTYESRKR